MCRGTHAQPGVKKVPYIDIEFLDMEIYIIPITGTMRSSETALYRENKNLPQSYPQT